MNLLAQVGINSPNPSKAAALDIVDDSRGVAIPRLTRAERTQLKDIAEYAPLPQGLLLYDTDDEMFYYYNPNNSANGTENWQGLTPFTMKDDRTEIISGIPMRTVETHKSVRDIRFFSNTNNAATRKLHIKGRVSISENNTTPPGTDYGLYVQSNGNFGDDINVTGTVTVSGSISGRGTFPIGGIMIWSGSIGSIPTGYALCDGTNGTPDLRNRFIVGAGSSYGIGSTGGQDSYWLSTNNLPSHSHTFDFTKTTLAAGSHYHIEGQHAEIRSGYNFGTGGSISAPAGASRNTGLEEDVGVRYRTSTDGEHSHTVIRSGNTASAGIDSSINNRPPYYALAYIQRKF